MVNTNRLRRKFGELMNTVDSARACERRMYNILSHKQHTPFTDFVSDRIYDLYAWRMNCICSKGQQLHNSVAGQLEELAHELKSEVRL